MPLPQQVINQLSQEGSSDTPGWSSGVLLFSGAIFIVMVVIYFGMTLVYEPHINGQVADLQSQVTTLSQSISSGDQANLITFYSQISNLKSLLARHIVFSQFFTWLGKNTEASVYYSQFSFASINQVTITGNAPSESDINQQIAIFEASPQVKKVAVTNVGAGGSGNTFQFSATLIMASTTFSSVSIATTTSS